jgi:2-C-methyl-D-erythritol 2,4-cyclodiphosphate synthase
VKVGFGYDVHRLVKGRKLLIGGIEIPFRKGEEGHSDGDVLIHAVIDALLGPAGLGDIGIQFPPNDPALAGISSLILLQRAKGMLGEKGFSIVNVDCAVILQEPRLAPFHSRIIASLASALGLPAEAVSLKARTKEGLGPVGGGRAVEAYAVALIEGRGS